MKKLFLILFSALFCVAFCFGFSACGIKTGGDSSLQSSASSEFDSSNEDSSSAEKIPYSITYNLGVCQDDPDATVSTTTQTVYYGEAFSMPTPTCDLYKFVCWALEGEDEPFTATEYPFEESIILVAQWKAPYYIEYDLGVCQGNPNAVLEKTEELVYFGEAFSMPTPACTLYKFVYWTVEGSTSSFTATEYPFEESITLVAKWKVPYYITYELGICAGNKDATIATTQQLVYYGEGMSLQKPTCNEYKFTGWTRKDTGEAFSGNIYLIEENVTLVANWKTPYYITYHLGELEDSPLVTVKPQKQTVYYDEMFALRRPSASTYKFVRWEVQGSGETVTSGKYAYEQDITLVAVWAASYTITYTAGDVEDPSQVQMQKTTQSVYYGESFTLETPTCAGYLFNGWKIQGEEEFFTDTVYTFEKDIVLVAIWEKRQDSDFH